MIVNGALNTEETIDIYFKGSNPGPTFEKE